MILEGVIIYTFISSFAVGLIAFGIAASSMFTSKAFGISFLLACGMSALFYLFTLWTKRNMIKNNEISFPFLPILLSEVDQEVNLNFTPEEYETTEMKDPPKKE